jgi:putative two-component system response regulator
MLAEALQDEHDEIDDAWIENLRVAASLHDIGKVGIPDAVLLKEGRLSEAERTTIERHPTLGADTLLAIRQRLGADPLIEMSVQICLMHHEKWDGSGYPCAIAGKDIPLAARIVALADVYDALTTTRSYRKPMSHAEACRVIEKGRANHFDPGVVEAFGRVADRFDQIRQMYVDRAEAERAVA